MRIRLGLLASITSAALLGACQPAVDDLDDPGAVEGKADSSVEATVLDFEWDGEAAGDSFFGSEQVIRDQLLYTIGELNGNRAVGRLDNLKLTNVVRSGTSIRYHAKMPVAWGAKTNLPTSYTFMLPRDTAALDAFATKYRGACTDYSPHPIDSGSMWYYFRPSQSGCKLDAADIVTMPVKVSVSPVNTDGKYPEYHKVWEDNALKVVAIFGKYEDGATSSSDAGIAAYNEFVRAVKLALGNYDGYATTPASVPTSPGAQAPEIAFRANVQGGRTIEITALLVDNIGKTTPEFDAHYAELSTRADLIAYNGHAGLGQNVRALARKGQWTAGQYLMLFMNGCDTFAYVDGSLAQTRATYNPDDPTGTKYMDFVVNAEPSYFHSDSEATLALVKGLLSYQAPKTYQQIFTDVDPSQVVLVTGEQDNVYYPGYGEPSGGGDGNWSGLEADGALKRTEQQRWTTPTLQAGAYVFAITGSSGDADLYVSKGVDPTTTRFDCRPYKSGSNEQCVVTFTEPTEVHVMVRGYASTSSAFHLSAHKK